MSKMWMRKMSKCEAEKVKLISYKYTVIIFSEMSIFKKIFMENKSCCVFIFSVQIAIARIQHQSQKTV